MNSNKKEFSDLPDIAGSNAKIVDDEKNDKNPTDLKSDLENEENTAQNEIKLDHNAV